MGDGEIHALDGKDPTIRELLNRGFNVVYHERLRPGAAIAVSYEATNKRMGVRFTGNSREGLREIALARLETEAAPVLYRPEPVPEDFTLPPASE